VLVLVPLAAGVAVTSITSSAQPAAPGNGAVALPPASTPAGPGTCPPPNPLTLQQLREVADQPAIAPTPLGPARSGGAALEALADSVGGATCTSNDRYAYVQLREWVADTRTSGGRTSLTPAVLQYQHWLAADGSGRAIAVTTRTPADQNPPTDDTYPPSASPVTPVTLPAEPGLPADWLDSITPSAAGPQAALRAIADIYQWQAPGRDARAGMLWALAEIDGLTYHGSVTDRAGRSGAAIAALSTNGTVRDLLIIDPATGYLLAHEQAALRDPGKLGITAPTVLSYTLYLAHDHTATVQQR
jgi:hypothetical protein